MWKLPHLEGTRYHELCTSRWATPVTRHLPRGRIHASSFRLPDPSRTLCPAATTTWASPTPGRITSSAPKDCGTTHCRHGWLGSSHGGPRLQTAQRRRLRSSLSENGKKLSEHSLGSNCHKEDTPAAAPDLSGVSASRCNSPAANRKGRDESLHPRHPSLHRGTIVSGSTR